LSWVIIRGAPGEAGNRAAISLCLEQSKDNRPERPHWKLICLVDGDATNNFSLWMSVFFPVFKALPRKAKKPTGGIEPPTFRLQSECSTTKLSRRPVGIWEAERPL
jgi:hypothetical protein